MHVLRPLCCSGLHSNVEQRGISLTYKQGKGEGEEENSIRMRLSRALRKGGKKGKKKKVPQS